MLGPLGVPSADSDLTDVRALLGDRERDLILSDFATRTAASEVGQHNRELPPSTLIGNHNDELIVIVRLVLAVNLFSTEISQSLCVQLGFSREHPLGWGRVLLYNRAIANTCMFQWIILTTFNICFDLRLAVISISIPSQSI